MRYTNVRIFMQAGAFWGLRTHYFHIFILKTSKIILGYNIVVNMANTYSHNITMHRDTTLKFGKLFDFAKYLGHKQKFQRTGCSRGGASSPTLHFRTPLSVSDLTEIERWNLVCLVSDKATCKNLSPNWRLGDQQPPLFILGPIRNSETNRARKLIFGMLVDTNMWGST